MNITTPPSVAAVIIAAAAYAAADTAVEVSPITLILISFAVDLQVFTIMMHTIKCIEVGSALIAASRLQRFQYSVLRCSVKGRQHWNQEAYAVDGVRNNASVHINIQYASL